MADPPERHGKPRGERCGEPYYLAAVAHSLGRAAARREVLRLGSGRAAFSALDDVLVEPGQLQRDCVRLGIRVLTAADDAYPPLLGNIPDAPLVLYARGDPAALLRPTVAIVGARRCTRVGAEVAGVLAGALAEQGVCVVSGLARGIDTAAHRAALERGLTAAVVGSGLARPYPRSNRALMDAIAARGGLLISEYPPWQSARRYHFPERNRLISGLAMAVVVVEAGEQSGSLITARMAAEQGREVCAVPGPVTSPVSRGCHRLIRQGAALVESAADVLEALGLERVPGSCVASPERPEDEALAEVLAAVEAAVTTLDEVIAATGLPGDLACAALVELELGGFVRQVPGGYIRRPFP